MEPPQAPVNVHELEQAARGRLPAAAWNYLVGGSGDEHTLRWNIERYAELRLTPRVLVDVSTLDTRVNLLGTELEFPLLLAPTAAHKLFHPGGECETARGASAAGALYVQSTLASTGIAEVGAAAAGPLWFQLYVQRDRDFTADLVARAEAAGARALVLTVDLPVLGARDRDRRNPLGLPQGVEYVNFAGLEAPVDPATADLPPHRRVYNPHLDPTLTWESLEWLRSVSRLPLVVKGILRADDAVRAVDHGAAGVIVSNHGARSLDTVPASIDALPAVAAAVDGRAPVLVDGGVRRGTDVAKALCLGADAVLIGRPYLWGLAVAGASGVQLVVEILRTELELAMGLLGAPTLADLTPDLLWRE